MKMKLKNTLREKGREKWTNSFAKLEADKEDLYTLKTEWKKRKVGKASKGINVEK